MTKKLESSRDESTNVDQRAQSEREGISEELLHEVVDRPVRQVFRWLKRLILVDVEGDQKVVIHQVLADVEIQGLRFWLLVASCLIASIGLNTNSAAVIIGAMLISPLMGPILGLGLGLAVGSRPILMASLRNFAPAVVFTLLLSAFYFRISPFGDPTAEILARTSPTLLDLVVAIAAAFAGVVTMASPGFGSIVPGVAIATAIMPPLCASGYGLAYGEWKVAGGAFYLFLINALAITLTAFVLFKRMKFQEREEDVKGFNILSPRVVAGLVLVTVIPLSWTLYRMWNVSREQQLITELVREYESELEIVNWKYKQEDVPELVVYTFKHSAEDIRSQISERLKRINSRARLAIHDTEESSEVREVISKVKESPLYSVLNDSSALEALVQKQLEAASARNNARSGLERMSEIERELSALLGADREPALYSKGHAERLEYLLLVKPLVGREARKAEARRLSEWMKVKLGDDSLWTLLWTDGESQTSHKSEQLGGRDGRSENSDGNSR